MSFASALRNHLQGGSGRPVLCEHCQCLVSPDEIVRIMRAGGQSVLWEGCYDCLEARLDDDDPPAPSFDLLRRAYQALTTPLSVHEHELICNELQEALAEDV